jgi:transcriptional antiterminator
MQFEKYVNRMQYLEELIEKERTGTPKELAKRLGISERMLYHYLDDLKSSKDCVFCRKKKSYIFPTLQ